MKVSLIMATISRTDELERFLNGLVTQTYRNYELIVVDQNEDDRLMPIVGRYRDQMALTHLQSEKGISKARNKGLVCASGDLISFPDDDCWYEPDLLERVVALFSARPELDIITGRSVDGRGQETTAKFDPMEGYVNKRNVWRRAVSFTIFHKRSVLAGVGGFDEDIGVGASTIYLSGEETDYILRALSDHQVYYYPSLTVYHPNPIYEYTPQTITRAYKYGCGFGKVVTKHQYPLSFKSLSLLKPFIGMLLYSTILQFPKSNYYWHSLKGRFRGML